MKKLIALVLLLGLCFTPVAFAEDAEDWRQEATLDAPNLVKLSDNWSLGSELNKRLDNSSADEDWTVGVKVTYSGSIFDVSKKNTTTE